MTVEKPLLIITGASKGIGRKTAELFSHHHFDVINLSRTPLNFHAVDNIPIDLKTVTAEDLKKLFAEKISHPRRIVLVHNASICYNDTIENYSAPAWQDTLTLNITVPALLTQCILPHMAEKSAIVFIGSTLSEKAVANTCSYTVSKHAIVGLMRATCQDLVGRLIHTCCVCPGITDTEMLRQRIHNDETLLAQLAQIQSEHRLLNAQEIADAIFVAAQHPVFNGAVLHANGGQIER